MEQVIFAAGCFWGVQYYFDQIPGVTQTTVGYTGGTTEDPTYEEVCSHTTGHAEAVLVEFDADAVIAGEGRTNKRLNRADRRAEAFRILLGHFFRMHDPTQLNRQGLDIGDNYRSAIFYVTDEQRSVAETALQAAQANFDEPIVTAIEPAGPFYQAEAYHQKFTERTGRGACHAAYEPLK